VLTVLGVAHIFDMGPDVRRIIEGIRPDAVGVELDAPRLHALRNPGGMGRAPLHYRLLAMAQKRLASKFGGSPGTEMLAAVDAASAIGADVLLIDADAQSAFGRLMREMSMKEKVKFMFSVVTALFLPTKVVKEGVDDVREDTDAMMEEMMAQFPTIKRVLVDDRNAIMSQRLAAAMEKYGNVVAVVGDGHVEGMLGLLGRDDVQVLRMKDILDGKGPEPERSNASVTMTFGPDQPDQ